MAFIYALGFCHTKLQGGSYIMNNYLKLGLCIFFTTGIQSYILIDPAHGGRFEGCKSASEKYLEKDLTLQLSIALKNELETLKIPVRLTRTTDKDFTQLPGDDAPAIKDDIINRLKPFKKNVPTCTLSIHFNQTPQRGIRGLELYVPFAGAYQDKSYRCASYIHRGLTKAMPQNWVGNLGNINSWDRGIRAAKFTLFDQLSCPMVLIEVDYISHRDVEYLMSQKKTINTIAQSLAQALRDYYNSR